MKVLVWKVVLSKIKLLSHSSVLLHISIHFLICVLALTAPVVLCARDQMVSIWYLPPRIWCNFDERESFPSKICNKMLEKVMKNAFLCYLLEIRKIGFCILYEEKIIEQSHWRLCVLERTSKCQWWFFIFYKQ